MTGLTNEQIRLMAKMLLAEAGDQPVYNIDYEILLERFRERAELRRLAPEFNALNDLIKQRKRLIPGIQGQRSLLLQDPAA